MNWTWPKLQKKKLSPFNMLVVLVISDGSISNFETHVNIPFCHLFHYRKIQFTETRSLCM